MLLSLVQKEVTAGLRVEQTVIRFLFVSQKIKLKKSQNRKGETIKNFWQKSNTDLDWNRNGMKGWTQDIFGSIIIIGGLGKGDEKEDKQR